MLVKTTKNNKGFTLVEIMVSVSIFAIVMFISSSAILSVFDANRKSQSIQAVMGDLNHSLEIMTRTIRFGTKYHCDVTQGVPTTPRDCASGATSINILDSTGAQSSFRLNNGVIEKSWFGVLLYNPITSPTVTITNLSFRVFGSAPYDQNGSSHDLSQPQVIIVVSGYAGIKPTSRTSFNLETTVSQRKIDSL